MAIQIESDLKEILERIEKRFDKVDEKFEKLDNKIEQLDNKIDSKIEEVNKSLKTMDGRLIKIETKIDEGITPRLDTLSEQVKEVKSSQQAQIWTLIVILFTAVTGFLIAVGKFVLSGNGV